MSSVRASLDEAMNLHRAGNLAAARQLYEQILASQPDHAQATSLLGLLIGQAGDWPRGVEQMRRAVDLDSSQPSLLVNLAEGYRALAQVGEAEQCYRRAIQSAPGSAEVHNGLATVLIQQGRLDEAITAYRDAVRLGPQYAEAHCNLASALQRTGNHAESESCFRRALQLNANYVPALNNLGTLLADQGRWAEAQAFWQRAVELEPACVDALSNLGNALQVQGTLPQAIETYRRALRHQGDHGLTLCNLGNALRESQRLEEALSTLELAVRVQPDNVAAHNNLGNVLQDLGRLEEARTCFSRAIKMAPRQAEFHLNLGTVLRDQGQVLPALAEFERSLILHPDHPHAVWCRGMALLSMGRFDEGWADYESRLRSPLCHFRRFDQPQWSGEPLNGRTLLVHCEQGLGDTLQFIRYVQLLGQRDGRVIVGVQPELMPLLAASGFTGMVSLEEPLPPFDLQVPLMSLPLVFRTRANSIPCDVPYLAADPARVERWREKLRHYSGLKVGIVWQGRPTFRGDRLRSVPLSCFAPLVVPDVHLFSLQKGAGSEQLAAHGESLGVIDLAEQLDNEGGAFMDTAAVMQQLDMVITSDTAAAHLAGALGVKVWVALSAAPEWRWMMRRDDSPWYPTMRLFRQRRPVEWTDVFKRMAAELQRLQ
jgi:tetratricopeptide (TPR) repeat protein